MISMAKGFLKTMVQSNFNFKDSGIKILTIVLLLVILSYFLFFKGCFDCELEVVIGKSMEPTLKDGQEVLVKYGNFNIKKGDIVVINFSSLVRLDVKSVLYLPGDDLSKENLVVDNVVYNQLENNNFVISKGYYFVRGDNTKIALDSSHYGLVLREQIVGRVID